MIVLMLSCSVVIKAISETFLEHKDDSVKLVNLILPELKVVLAKQGKIID